MPEAYPASRNHRLLILFQPSLPVRQLFENPRTRLSPAEIPPRLNLATRAPIDGHSREPTSTQGPRTPHLDPTSTSTRQPTQTPTPSPTATLTPLVPTLTPSPRQTDGRAPRPTLTPTVTAPVPTLSPTVTSVAESNTGGQDQQKEVGALTLQEFYEAVCKLNDRVEWWRGPKAEWTWKDVSNDFRSVIKEYEPVVPPDALREFHKASLEVTGSVARKECIFLQPVHWW